MPQWFETSVFLNLLNNYFALRNHGGHVLNALPAGNKYLQDKKSVLVANNSDWTMTTDN